MAVHTVVFHLIKVSKRMQNALGLKTSGLELSPSEANTLIIIESHKNINQANIALKLHLKPASVVSLIDKLEGMNLVTRNIGQEDRRKFHIHLTAKGIEEVKKIRQKTRVIDEYIKSKLTEKEFEVLFSTLDKLSEDDDLKIEHLQNLKSKEVKNEIPGAKRLMAS